MKKVMVVLLSLVLLLGAVLPVGADAAAQTTPCAPGEHKTYRDIFTFVHDPEYRIYDGDDFYQVAFYGNGLDTWHEPMAMWSIIENGTLTIDFYAYGGEYDSYYATITYNGETIVRSNSAKWESITISVKANDEVILRYHRYGPDGGACQFRASGAVWKAADDTEPTCTESVVCDLCGTVVKDTLPHTYDTEVDADCNMCGAVRDVTYTGWWSQNGKWYYYENGVKLTNTWKKDSVGLVYLGAGGDMLTNTWVKHSVGWCYVGKDGYCVLTNQWVKDSVGWCYFGADGRMLTDTWVKDSVGWCYVGTDGYCVTNRWVKDSVGWCYLGADGRMLTNAWVKDSVGWCYVGKDGRAVTEQWVKDTVGWCYLDKNGRVTKGAWVETGGKWYFVDIYGYMVTGKQYINGKWYYFDAMTGALAE